MSIKISTDSTADSPKSFCEELNISVLPLTILHEDREYRDGVDITPAQMYDILELLSDWLDALDGADMILGVSLTSALPGCPTVIMSRPPKPLPT